MDKKLLNKYNGVIIVNPELKYIEDIKEKIINILGNKNVKNLEDQGDKELDYQIKGYKTGHYIYFEFYTKDYEVIKELEKYFRINDDILKYITIKVEEGTQDSQEYAEPLYKILDIYTENSWEDYPLDDDETEKLIELLRLKLNLINGNITQEEYDEIYMTKF